MKQFAENNGVEVIRTLKIIKLLNIYKIISNYETVQACILLKKNKCTRIPIEEIDKMIKEFEKNSEIY